MCLADTATHLPCPLETSKTVKMTAWVDTVGQCMSGNRLLFFLIWSEHPRR